MATTLAPEELKDKEKSGLVGCDSLHDATLAGYCGVHLCLHRGCFSWHKRDWHLRFSAAEANTKKPEVENAAAVMKGNSTLMSFCNKANGGRDRRL